MSRFPLALKKSANKFKSRKNLQNIEARRVRIQEQTRAKQFLTDFKGKRDVILSVGQDYY
jgi:hypothetical protein